MPNRSAISPPRAGPNAVPAAKALMIGAMVEARLSGVEMSAMVMVAAVLRAATPRPVKSRQTNRCSNWVARPIPPTPRLTRRREWTRYGFRPCRSTSMADGTLPTILARAKADTTTPYCPGDRPMLSTTKGITGVTIPTDDPTSSMEMAMGTVRRESISDASWRRCFRKDDLVTMMDGGCGCGCGGWRGDDPVSGQPQVVVASAGMETSRNTLRNRAASPEA
mmetsp:Transcript_17867/g.51169  ORF Transcript_17867/g.51169 Transcript_17867/m.51169 type:complete len:222 (+) Transcript_17867:919-1584(+)